MVLYLIRHGRTEANEHRLYCGASDLPLSEGGRTELGQLSYEIPPSCRFFTSGMKRTEQTLMLLFGDVPHRADPRLREVNFGDFELHSYGELKDDPAYQLWLTGDNEKNIPPHGESGLAMQQRVLEALDVILRMETDTVLVCHGGTIACIMAALFPKAGKNRYEWQPAPGHGWRVERGTYTAIP